MSILGLARRARNALPIYLRAQAIRVVDATAPVVAERLYAFADRVAFTPFHREVHDVPLTLDANGEVVDVVADLSSFTGLADATVRTALERRQAISFRSEWWATPAPLRNDHWFYLSSKAYLFANAVHFPDASFVDELVVPHVPRGGRVLDFGGGAGSLTLALAARGFAVTFTEINALQRDFVRFRLQRHSFGARVEVLDWWQELPPESFDAVVAVDVLEHLDDGPATVERLVRSLKTSATFIEDSPFVAGTPNPMHHEDFGLTDLLASAGFAQIHGGPTGTRVWRRSAAAGGEESAPPQALES
jgi:SAM-dependent methyltransferase